MESLFLSTVCFIPLFILVTCIGIFILFNHQQLTDNEVIQLANKRRRKQIRQYFTFDRSEVVVNAEFKKHMKPNGEFQSVNVTLVQFPAIAAGLLKYKKHEWIIVAFEKDKRINTLWLNKGFDRTKVSLRLPAQLMARTGITDNDKSVLIFHNHPNSDPSTYNCTKPSNQDLISATGFAEILNSEGMNLLEFVCERGRHYQYFESITDGFLCLSEYITGIKTINGTSWQKNLALHFERIF